MTTVYSKKSIFYSTPQNNFALGYYVHRKLQPDKSDTYVILSSRHAGKPTLLSYDLYATPAYWWIFNVLNMDVIKDPLRDFKESVVLRVPNLTGLQQLIG